jgi:hypothetical protein
MRERNVSGNFVATAPSSTSFDTKYLKPIPHSRNQTPTVMKTTFYSILAAAACGMAFGQTTAYTNPVGYSSKSLAVGFNAIGLTLQKSPVASGTFETVSGTVLTDSDVTYAPVAGRTYVLEVTSGTAVGNIQEVLAANISGSVITTPQAIGIAVGDTYNLRLAPTLEEIFSTTTLANGGVLFAALNSTSADVIWVPTGTGSYDKYYLKSGTTPAFYKFGSTTLTAPNIPVVYTDGLFVQKKTVTASTLTVSGEVKKVGSNSVMIQGYNLLSIVAPTGLNLFNSGLATSMVASLSATNADILWVQKSDLTYDKYFRHSTAPGNWRKVSTPTVNMTQAEAEAVILSDAVQIQHKANTTVAVKFAVPSSYSSF